MKKPPIKDRIYQWIAIRILKIAPLQLQSELCLQSMLLILVGECTDCDLNKVSNYPPNTMGKYWPKVDQTFNDNFDRKDTDFSDFLLELIEQHH